MDHYKSFPTGKHASKCRKLHHSIQSNGIDDTVIIVAHPSTCGGCKYHFTEVAIFRIQWKTHLGRWGSEFICNACRIHMGNLSKVEQECFALRWLKIAHLMSHKSPWPGLTKPWFTTRKKKPDQIATANWNQKSDISRGRLSNKNSSQRQNMRGRCNFCSCVKFS